MTETLRLTTVAQVKRYLRMTPQQIASGGASVPTAVAAVDDALLDDLVAAASDDLANYCGRNFGITNYTETRDGTGTNVLVLQNWPVTSIDSLSIIGPRQSVSAITPTQPLTQNVDFVFGATGTVQLYSLRFPKGVANVIAVYNAGYAAVPADLAHAAAKWGAIRYREFDRLGQRSKAMGGETVNFDISEFAPDIAGILNNYRARAAIPGLVAETL